MNYDKDLQLLDGALRNYTTLRNHANQITTAKGHVYERRKTLIIIPGERNENDSNYLNRVSYICLKE
jgi:hypothetical protein